MAGCRCASDGRRTTCRATWRPPFDSDSDSDCDGGRIERQVNLVVVVMMIDRHTAEVRAQAHCCAALPCPRPFLSPRPDGDGHLNLLSSPCASQLHTTTHAHVSPPASARDSSTTTDGIACDGAPCRLEIDIQVPTHHRQLDFQIPIHLQSTVAAAQSASVSSAYID